MPGPLHTLIGGGIGLATEYNAHRKANKSTKSIPHDADAVEERRQSAEHSDRSTDHDEDNWELDEVHDTRHPHDEALFGEDGMPTEQILTAFFNRYPEPPSYSSSGRLSAPVILPQRRPKMNTRGFVRAYAPDLQSCSIDEKMWLDFLTGFHKAIKMSPAFHVANLAVGTTAITLQAVGVASLPVAAGALAIHITVEASRRTYVHYNTNKYLDSMNDRLFHPRGLHAVIMKYDPSSNSPDQVVDVNTAIQQAVSSRMDPTHRSKLKMSSGTTTSDFQMPAAAPLIFPSLDQFSQADKAKHEKTSFLADYFDRRAQAKFAAQNPGSSLNVLPQTKFASRYSDPNSAANTGGLVSLVSGGRVPDRRTRRQNRYAEYGQNGQNGQNYGGNMQSTQYSGQNSGADMPPNQYPPQNYGGNMQAGQYPPQNGRRSGRGPIGMLKKAIGENVLYLMVVNLPNEEEMAQVKDILDKQSAGVSVKAM